MVYFNYSMAKENSVFSNALVNIEGNVCADLLAKKHGARIVDFLSQTSRCRLNDQVETYNLPQNKVLIIDFNSSSNIYYTIGHEEMAPSK